MKISKLFHWLYAILMLLPFLVFLPNAFYYGFNEHAVAQEKTEQVPVYYESNEVNSVDDLVVGNVYRFNYTTNTFLSSQAILCYDILNYSYSISVNNFNDYQIPYIQIWPNNYIYFTLKDTTLKRQLLNGYIDFVYKNNSNFTEIQYVEKCNEKYIKEYQPVTTNMSIIDSMSYAWDSVWQNDLFSWSYGSFLTEPFIYIGNLFNVPVDNTLYYALSYWLDISIIWLTFDLVMYIPLLVHRWLDKGIIE